LRAKIQTAQIEGGLKTLLFVSTSKGEGSALTAANTAATLAYAGNKVILVDCDFRTPNLHDIFNLQNKGVTNIINENMPLAGMLQPSGITNLRVLASGPVPEISSEVLFHGTMREIIVQLKCLADYVVFTSSPLIVASNKVVSDACVLASRVDGVIIIVETRTVRVHAVSKVMALLKGARANIIGGVLDNVSDEKDFIF